MHSIFIHPQHMKQQSRNWHAILSVRLLIFIFNVSLCISVNSQILLSPQITSKGSVVPLIQPKTAFEIHHSECVTYSNYAKRHCGDSLFQHSSNEGDMGYCIYEFDFTSKWLNDRRFERWANNSDPFSIQELDVFGYDDRWYRKDPLTWHYSFSPASGNEYYNKQTWKFGEKKRLEKITRWFGDFDNKPQMELEYFYNLHGSLERISTRYYEPGAKLSSISQQVWYYDEKKRTRMMICYRGSYRQLSIQELEAYAKKVETGIRTGKHERIVSADSLDITSLLIYNNGSHGPVQVNYYARYGANDGAPIFVSDSLNYDEKGRVRRYISGKFAFQVRQYSVELTYDYEPRSSRLKQVIFHRYNERQHESRLENKTIQLFTYDSHGRIDSSTEQQFYIESNYMEGKYTEPEEQLLGEDKSNFKYKP